MSGVRVGVRGERDTTETLDGSACIRLSPQTTLQNWIRLTLLGPTDLVIVSPWDARVQLASFANSPQSRVSVVVAERGQKRSLEDPAIIRALLRRVNQGVVPQNVGAEESAAERHAKALQNVAHYFGFEPDEVEAAIHTWAQNIQVGNSTPGDRYDRALTELYARHYPAAARDLIVSVISVF